MFFTAQLHNQHNKSAMGVSNMLQKIEGPWPRREHFQHYMNTVRCTYSMTVQIDITRLSSLLKANQLKVYPAQIYLISSVVNRFPPFRMGITASGEPGYWEISHPSYTVLNPDTKTFSSIWTPFDTDFSLFYPSCAADIDQYSRSTVFIPQGDMPPNVFDLSSLPWIEFSAFNLNIFSEGTHLAPIFTIGRHREENGRVFMPLALQLHHAACDGYHAGQFIEALTAMAADCERWI